MARHARRAVGVDVGTGVLQTASLPVVTRIAGRWLIPLVRVVAPGNAASDPPGFVAAGTGIVVDAASHTAVTAASLSLGGRDPAVYVSSPAA